MTALSFVWVHPYSQNSGCDIGAQCGAHTLSSHKLRADIYCSIHSVPVL